MKNKKGRQVLRRSVLSSAILGALGSAHAATINVGGLCNLVDAIEAANTDAVVGSCTAGNGDDIIQVVSANSGITISTIFEPAVDAPGNVGLPVIDSTITIEGNGLTIQANNNTDNFRLFHVYGINGDLTLRDTTITGADDGYGIGSGLFSSGRVTLDNTTFYNNNTALFLVDSYGNEINNSVIRHNTNDSGYSAGLQTYFAGVSINNSSFFDNEHSNSASRGGGPNASGAMSLFQSNVTISNSTISGNRSVVGAGIIVNSVPPPPVPAEGRFINSPMRGVIGSVLNITNSTISNNQAFIAAGVLQFGDDSEINLQGSIVSGNEIRGGGYADNGYLFNPAIVYGDANNIIGDDGDPKFQNLTIGGSDVSFSGDAKDNLYPLSMSNGQFVHPLKDGSVAIDGNDPTCFGSLFDQEGKGRGIDGDDNGSFICDIGAFEHSLVINADGAPCTLSNAIISANTDSGVGGCQPGKGHDIIVLPTNSMQVQNAAQYYLQGSPYLPFAFPGIDSAITIEGNGSTLARDVAASTNFDVLAVNTDGQLNLIDAIVSGSSGGVSSLVTLYGNINLQDSTITGNFNGGLADLVSVNSSVVNSTFENNQQIIGYFSGNYGVMSSFYSIGFELKNSTISNNQVALGAVDLRANTMATVENSTISGNIGQTVGGMLVFSAGRKLPNRINHSTITDNEGTVVGGAYAVAYAPGDTRFSHTIISGNTQLPPPPVPALNPSVVTGHLLPNRQFTDVVQGAIVNGGGSVPNDLLATPYVQMDSFNIVGQNNDSYAAGGVILGMSDVIPPGPTSTVIDGLADNGGDTQTHLPVAGGLAVDGGTPINCLPPTDQNDRIRPWDGDGNGTDICDIGAVEFRSVTESDLIFKDGFNPTIILRRTLVKN